MSKLITFSQVNQKSLIEVRETADKKGKLVAVKSVVKTTGGIKITLEDRSAFVVDTKSAGALTEFFSRRTNKTYIVDQSPAVKG